MKTFNGLMAALFLICAYAFGIYAVLSLASLDLAAFGMRGAVAVVSLMISARLARSDKRRDVRSEDLREARYWEECRREDAGRFGSGHAAR